MILLYFWNSHFILKTNTHFSIENQLILIAILYWKSMKNVLLKKNNWFVSFKNFRITLYFLYRDFQRHFSIDFAILLKLPFYIKNQYTFFYWKSIGFCQHHFSTENQYKIFYWITCTFSTCDIVLKTNIIFSIENQLIFISIIFILKISTKFSIECTVHFKLLFALMIEMPFFVWKLNTNILIGNKYIIEQIIFLMKINTIFFVKIPKIFIA